MAEAATAPKVEVSKNCAGCNKPMKKVVKYYRNGKYYCNKKCWQKGKPQPAQAAETAEKKE